MPKKILVVDDEEDMVAILLRRLKHYGYETACAHDGKEALRAIKEERFDLVISDIMMPVMDGAQLARVLRSDPTTKDIPLIFLTALQAQDEKTSYGIAESETIFTKPFDIKALVSKIEEKLITKSEK